MNQIFTISVSSLTKACTRSLMAILMMMAPLFVNAQFNQNIAGGAAVEDLWESYSVGNGYVAIGNTQNSFANAAGVLANGIWFSPYQPNVLLQAGQVVIQDPAGIPVYASDFSPFNGGYYITGERSGNAAGNAGRNMIVIKTDPAGNVMWSNILMFPQGMESWGVSTVTLPSQDVVVVGNMRQPGTVNTWVIAARFTPLGNFVWSQMYMNNTAQQVEFEATEATLDMTPTGAVIFNSAGLAVPAGPGVAITGRYKAPQAIGAAPADNTFVMQLDGAGAEQWRSIYPCAFGVQDKGFDIIQDQATLDFVVAGTSSDAAGIGSIYAIRLNNGGAPIWQNTYTAANGQMFSETARAIEYSHNAQNFVLAGNRNNGNTAAGNNIDDIIMMEIDGFTGMPMWHNNYNISDPAFRASEGVRRVPGGYVLTGTTAQNGTDGYIAFTDMAGLTPCVGCPVIPEPYVADDAPQMIPLPFNQAVCDWNPMQLISTPVQPVETPCAPDPCIVTAGFTYTVVGNTITFTNTSTGNGTLAYNWSFGSMLANPVHTVAGPGTYVFCLTVTNTNSCGQTCTDVKCVTIVIDPCSNVISSWCFSLNGSVATFSNFSTTGTGYSYQWIIDGVNYSTLYTPAAKNFSTAYGLHTVCLRVRYTGCDLL